MSEHIWDSPSGNFVVENRRGVGVIRIDRPDSLNALSVAMRAELAEIFRELGNDDALRGLVLTGTGRAFCAGEDLYELSKHDEPNWITEGIELFHDLTRAALSTTVPIVAALNGIVVGGAAELTLCFDYRVAAPEAEYFFPENHLGLTISNACSYLMHRLIGRRALDVILSSRRLNAEQALEYGFVDEVSDGDVIDAAIDVIDRWTPPGNVTAAHLLLLRPALAEVETAFARETEVALAAEEDLEAAVSRFVSRDRS
jgi:enoyl-CoA hydratase/carnithine racemase